MHDAHRILHGHELRGTSLDVALRPPEAGQDEGFLAGDQMRPVQLRGDLYCKPGPAQRLLGGVRIRACDREVASEAHEGPRAAREECLDRLDGRGAGCTRWLEAELGPQTVEKGGLGALPDPHGPVALDVAVPAYRAHPRARLAEVPPEQEQVHDLLDVGDTEAVLGETHGPGHDDAFRTRVEPCQLAHRLAGDTALTHELSEAHVREGRAELLEAGRVPLEELVVEDAARLGGLQVEQLLHHALEERDVTPHSHLDEAGQRCPRPEPLQRVLGVREGHEPTFAQRVDADDLTAALRGPPSCPASTASMI